MGRYRVDFYLPDTDIIIEADGDPWHLNKAKDTRREHVIMHLFALQGKSVQFIRFPGHLILSAEFEEVFREHVCQHFS